MWAFTPWLDSPGCPHWVGTLEARTDTDTVIMTAGDVGSLGRDRWEVQPARQAQASATCRVGACST